MAELTRVELFEDRAALTWVARVEADRIVLAEAALIGRS